MHGDRRTNQAEGVAGATSALGAWRWERWGHLLSLWQTSKSCLTSDAVGFDFFEYIERKSVIVIKIHNC